MANGKLKPRKRPRSMKTLLYHLWKNGQYMNRYNLAVLCEQWRKEDRYNLLVDVGIQVGYVVKERGEITDYQRRRLPKYRIGRYVYYLQPKDPDPKIC